MTDETKQIIEEFRRYQLGTKGNKERSVNNYLKYLRMFFNYIGKNPGEITGEDVENYIIHLKVELKNAINTQKIKQTALRIFYAWFCRKYQYQNPCEWLHPIQEEVKIPIMPTPDELTRMVYSCDVTTDIGRRDAAIICLLADTGIRLSEIVALNLSSIQVHENNYLLVVPRIKSWERLVPFGALIKGKLIAEFFSAYYNDIVYIKQYNPHDPLFKQDGPIIKGGRLSARGIRRIIAKYTALAEVDKNITPHSMRHFFGTYSIINGTTLQDLKPLMGHARIETTMRYVHIKQMLTAESVSKRGTSGLKAPDSHTGFVEMMRKTRTPG
jgi:site-specific recombinase XerD